MPDAPGRTSRSLASRLLPEPGPKRALAAAVLINTVGTGLYSTSSALFFTRSVGLAIPLVGIGLIVAAFVGLLAGIPAGNLADRWDPRWTWIVTLAGEAVTMAAFVLAHSFIWFLVIACLNQLAASGGAAPRTPVIRRIGSPDPARFRAYLRAITNVGIGLGALAAAAAIQANTRLACSGRLRRHVWHGPAASDRGRPVSLGGTVPGTEGFRLADPGRHYDRGGRHHACPGPLGRADQGRLHGGDPGRGARSHVVAGYSRPRSESRPTVSPAGSERPWRMASRTPGMNEALSSVSCWIVSVSP